MDASQHARLPCLLQRPYPPLPHAPRRAQLASAGSGLDVVKVAEAQPRLLLLQGPVWDDLEALKEQLAVGLSGASGLTCAWPGGM